MNLNVISGNYRLIASILILGELFTGNKLEAQIQNDTIWGSGVFWVKNSNGTTINNEEINCTPLQMQGDTIPNTTYNFTTSGAGQAIFTLPVYIDLGTGIDKHKSIDAIVAPNPSSDFTFAFHGKPTSDLHIYNMACQLIEKVKVNYDPANNVSGAYINMTEKASGNYVFSAMTENGKVSGKIVKTNTPPSGRQTPELSENSPLKSISVWDAVYGINISHEGYYDFNDQISIHDGQNGLIALIMEQLPGIPQYQFVGGTVKDEDGNPLSGATVWIKEQGTNSPLSQTTSLSDGTYLLPDSLLTGTDFYFGVGGIDGKFSFVGDEASVPNNITQWDDTLTTNYRFVLPDKVRQVPGEPAGTTVQPTAAQIHELEGGSQVEYAIRDSILWNQSTFTWTEAQKQGIRDGLENGMTLFGLEGAYVEVDYLLNNVSFLQYNAYTNPFIGQIGVNVAPGTDETNIVQVAVTTPLGRTYSSSPAAEVTISGDEAAFYKEFFGRVFYFNEVSSRPSFMNTTGTIPNFLDRTIVNLIVNYHKQVFNPNEPNATFDFDNIVEDISGKSYENPKENKTAFTLPLKETPLP